MFGTFPFYTFLLSLLLFLMLSAMTKESVGGTRDKGTVGNSDKVTIPSVVHYVKTNGAKICLWGLEVPLSVMETRKDKDW